MDPLSITVSSLALGAAARSALSFLLALQTLKEYQSWIKALAVELEDFHLVIERCHAHLVRRSSRQKKRGLEGVQDEDDDDDPILGLAVLRAHCVLRDLEEPLRGLVTGSVGKRRVRWVFGKERVTALRQGIRDAKLTLVLALAQAGMYVRRRCLSSSLILHDFMLIVRLSGRIIVSFGIGWIVLKLRRRC